ncbi:MAG: hypothetical protein Q7U14_04300, partial [Lacisediminimonas sp.]|nr:hypothetical protein [Lacisediminimonas sp.]
MPTTWKKRCHRWHSRERCQAGKARAKTIHAALHDWALAGLPSKQAALHIAAEKKNFIACPFGCPSDFSALFMYRPASHDVGTARRKCACASGGILHQAPAPESASALLATGCAFARS